jgi:hypothetical protein
MRIGAKIMLSTGLDAARDGLAGLADSGWLMRLPSRPEAGYGHPAGAALPGYRGPGGGAGLVAVMFGALPASSGSPGQLPVHWESLDPDDALALLLVGDITPAVAAQGNSTLTLAGFCRLLPGAHGSYEQGRLDAVKEAVRSFITGVALAIAPSAGSGPEPPSPGPAWAWLTGQRSAP